MVRVPAFSMGLAKRGALIRAFLGLVVGSGACYWLYKRLFPSKDLAVSIAECKDKASSKSQNTDVASDLLVKVAGMSVVPSVRKYQPDVPINPASNLEAQHVRNLLELLQATEEPSIREKALITLSNSAAFSVNQDLIRNLGGISIIANLLSDPASQVKVQALHTLGNLSMNIENQKLIKEHIANFCTIVDVNALNSSLQSAALRVLTNMAVTDEYHDLMAPAIPCFLRVLVQGDDDTKVRVLKVLVNLSANSSMTRHLLSAPAPSSLVSFVDQCTNGDCLVPALTFVANLNENMRCKDSATCRQPYSEDSLFAALFGDSEQNMQKWSCLLQHQDEDVKRQIARILTT